MSLMGILDRVADKATFDKAIGPAQRAVQAVLKPQAVKDLLHGTWLGHPLHPVLVQVPVGSWTSAGLLDAIPPLRPAATVFIGACSHLSGPLYEGRVEEVRGTECLVCPWHGSAFDLDSGSPRRGPAANPQDKLEVRMEACRVMALLSSRHREARRW